MILNFRELGVYFQKLLINSCFSLILNGFLIEISIRFRRNQLATYPYLHPVKTLNKYQVIILLLVNLSSPFFSRTKQSRPSPSPLCLPQ